MVEQPECPICGQQRWRLLGEKVYRLSDMPCLGEYVRQRYRVLFELWMPGHTEAKLASRVCDACGFVTCTPRPSAADVNAKYEFLETLRSHGGDCGPSETTADRHRADLLYRLLAQRLPKSGPARILDFGGADGRLMSGFVARGHICQVLDYRSDTCAGVTRIGRTEADLPDDATYDLIICSHVIEHLADPLPVVLTLKRHLAERGVLFVEVPMEIWGRPPLQDEPVTHINFFNITSLTTLLEQAGLKCCTCGVGAYGTGDATDRLVVRAVSALPEGGEVGVRLRGSKETERLLRPDLFLKIKKLWHLPSHIPPTIKSRLVSATGTRR